MISIIIPTYNYSNYLPETLNSVSNQSYSNWECIIVDDGSTDDTKERVAQIIKKDNRFRYIYQENKGVSAARNNGVKQAKGEFIQFLDGDDLLQKNKLKSQIEILEQNKHIDIVYNDVRFFDDGALHVLKTSLKGNKKDTWLPKISAKGAVVITEFTKINFMVMNAPLLRKNLFDKIAYFDETMKALEDWDFWMRCALENCYFHFNEGIDAFALVRVHEGSLSTQKKIMNKGHFLFLQHSFLHKNLNSKYKGILFIKYVELFWDSVFLKFYFAFHSFFLFFVSILMFPFYLLIKAFRLFKKH